MGRGDEIRRKRGRGEREGHGERGGGGERKRYRIEEKEWLREREDENFIICPSLTR